MFTLFNSYTQKDELVERKDDHNEASLMPEVAMECSHLDAFYLY